MCASSSFEDWLFASGRFDTMCEVRDKLFANLGLKDRQALGYRQKLDKTADLAAVEEFFLRHNSCQPVAGGRLRTVTGRPLDAGLFNMREQGAAEVLKAAAAFATGEHYTVRRAQALSVKEGAVGVAAADRVTSAITVVRAELEASLLNMEKAEQQ